MVIKASMMLEPLPQPPGEITIGGATGAPSSTVGSGLPSEVAGLSRLAPVESLVPPGVALPCRRTLQRVNVRKDVSSGERRSAVVCARNLAVCVKPCEVRYSDAIEL